MKEGDRQLALLQQVTDALRRHTVEIGGRAYIETEAMIDIRSILLAFSPPDHADEASPRLIGYTAEECERDMRRLTNGERGCANPEEHAS